MGVDYNALSDLIATTLRDLPKGEFEAKPLSNNDL